VVAEFDGVTVVLTGLPSRDLNLSFIEREPRDPAKSLADAEAWSVHQGQRFALDLEEGAHPAVRAAAESIGLHPEAVRPAMVLEVGGGPVRAAVGDTEVRVVAAEAEREALVRIEAAGSGFPPEVAERLFPPEILDEPGLTAYLGWSEGTPAGAALIHIDDRAAGVYWVATVPSMRRRGVAAAVLARALEDARANADFAWLQASSAGRPLYERLGFRWAGDWTAWTRPTG
jgi:GNAT superfamily N-acetyltransferase